MFASTCLKPEKRGALPVQALENELRLFLMIEKANFKSVDVVYSSWYTFRGYLWRIMCNPHGRQEKKWVSVFLENGGPDLASDSSSKRHPRTWRCPVRVNFTLLHPSKWDELGISEKNTCGMLPTNSDLPASPRDHVKYFFSTFDHTDARGYGIFTFARSGMIQPGLFADDDFNFVVVCQAHVRDYFDSTSGIPWINEVSLSTDNTGRKQDYNFDTALEERTALVEKLVQYDEVLVSSKQPSVRFLLEKEIKNISHTLEILPDLHQFL